MCFLLYPFIEPGSEVLFHTLSLMFVLLANWKPERGVLPHTYVRLRGEADHEPPST